MAWTDPATWVDGTVVTAAALNLHVRDNLRYLYAGGGQSGTAFPGSPAVGDRFFRTDLGWLCYWDGTRWLTCHEYTCSVGLYESLVTSYSAATTDARRGSIRSDRQAYITRLQASIFTGGTNNGSNYMTYTIVDDGGTTIWTFNTSAVGASAVYQPSATTPTNQPTAARNWLRLNLSITGAPSAQFVGTPFVSYRLIVT